MNCAAIVLGLLVMYYNLTVRSQLHISCVMCTFFLYSSTLNYDLSKCLAVSVRSSSYTSWSVVLN